MNKSQLSHGLCHLLLLVGLASCKTSEASLEKKAQDGAKELVFVLSGQSNMAGQTPLSDEMRNLKVPNVEIFCVLPYRFEKDREVYKAGNPAPNWESLKPCGASPETFGPEMSFAAAAHKAHPNSKIYLIKFAHGGTSLGCEWQPLTPSSAYSAYGDKACSNFISSNQKEVDSLRSYERLLTAVKWGMDGLSKRGIKPGWGGFLWFQGEADADGRKAFKFLSDSYQVNLQHFVKSIRNDLKQPALPFVAGKIKCGYSNAEWGGGANPLEVVRKAQQKLAEGDSNFFTFDTMDLKFMADGCHFEANSMKTIGQRFAEALP